MKTAVRYHSNFQNNWSRERPWNHLAPMSRGKVSAKKGHCSDAELESKSSLFPSHSFHIDSDVEFVHVIPMPSKVHLES